LEKNAENILSLSENKKFFLRGGEGYLFFTHTVYRARFLCSPVSGSLRAKPGCGCPAWQRRH